MRERTTEEWDSHGKARHGNNAKEETRRTDKLRLSGTLGGQATRAAAVKTARSVRPRPSLGNQECTSNGIKPGLWRDQNTDPYGDKPL